MLRYFSFILVLCMFICSCNPEDDNGSGTSGDPSNLTIQVDVATDGSGEVVVSASADNTTRYEFYMGDGNPNEPFENTTGMHQYTYESIGTYKVEVRAYGSSGRFIKKEQQIAVVTGDPSTVGEGYTTPTSYPGMQLVWTDEFNGNTIDSNNWTFEVGDGCPHLCGWGNDELEYYRKENASVGGGFLTIEAREEFFGGRNYTSARMKTQEKQTFEYGRVDIRAKLPEGQGIWPALWMLGQNINSVSWPDCGEIDIMELVGSTDGDGNSRVYGTLHWKTSDGSKADEGENFKLNSGKFSDKFHVFSIIWNELNIRWFVDDELYFTMPITDEGMTEFHQPHFFIFNIAVGGTWPGSPNDATPFPQQMLVDYIRVFQDN